MANRVVESDYEYKRVTPLVWVRKEQEAVLTQVDSLILDIDGVIMDVSNSFRIAISQTVQNYFCYVLGFKGDDILLSPSETQAFKLAGGFNNDWDLTSAAVLFYLIKAEQLTTDQTSVIREQGQSIEDFTMAVRRTGGGIEGAREVMLTTLTREQRKKVEPKWNRATIEKTFQEMYGGVDYCERLYGFKPAYNRRQGLLNDERVMIDPEVIKPFLPKVGILTGRTKNEMDIALERSGLKDMIDPGLIISDGGSTPDKRKPHPENLIKLARKIKGQVTVYVGDVLDDLIIVNNANVNREAPSVFMSSLVVSPLRRAEVEFYMLEGADMISLDVNDALKSLVT